jgi:hypothetical protein
MRYLFISFYIILISACVSSCKKAISIQKQQETVEERLNVTINPDPGSLIAVALSESFSYQLLINSIPPKKGVSIDINVSNFLNKKIVFSQLSQTNSNDIRNFNLEIKNLDLGILYVVKTTVTSLSDSTNKAYSTFQISRK